MNINDLKNFFIALNKNPFKTITLTALFIILIFIGIWLKTFIQKHAERIATSEKEPVSIYIKETGFKGISGKMDRRDIRQIFGIPEYEEEMFWQYKGFGIGFNGDYVGNINFYFGEGVNWVTEDSIKVDMSKNKILGIYGTPKQAAFEGNILYYDGFNIGFDDKDKIFEIVVHVQETDGLTFSEIEDLLSDTNTDKYLDQFTPEEWNKAWGKIIKIRDEKFESSDSLNND